MKLNKAYWEDRYEKNILGWDAGAVTTPLKEYIDQIEDKNLKILVPGAGNGYEVVYLWEQGFKNTYVVDLATQPLQRIREKLPEFPQNQLIQEDFFCANHN